ncbi:MAG TPA: fibronectin type III domain-containing protein [Mycobacteriales bacterium]|nr:fibronectin type III domain-containing protein [Mycobacteriales bacterium]
MRIRTRSALAGAALAVGLVGAMAVVPESARALTADDWCSPVGTKTTRCIESVSYDDGTGVGPVSLTPSTGGANAKWDVHAFFDTVGGAKTVSVTVWNNDEADPLNLGGEETLDDVWRIHLRLGTWVPRIVFLHGDALVAKRVNNGDGTYELDITGSPAHLTTFVTSTGDGGCDQSVWPWVCPETADGERYYWGADVSDNGQWTDVDQRDAFYGFDYATNVEATDIPPQVRDDATTGLPQLIVNLANPHYYTDGSTVFHGFVHMRIPNRFLRTVYGIDDPASMTSSGLTADYTGADTSAGTTTISQDAGDDAMLVDATGLRFSAKRLHVRVGSITPTRPRDVRASRSAVHRARVAFDRSRSRGSKVTSYTVRCVARSGSDVETARGSGPPIVVRGLTAGVAYDCRVRANSKAGHSRWSSADGVPRRP